jgi:tetratricopeptide (TPR) repeat protein
MSPEESRDICLADPNDGSPIGEAIAEHQSRARKLPGKADEWIRIGNGWVRKARRSADPGFYLNVEACAEAAIHADPSSIAALDLRSLALMNDHRFAEARDVAKAILVKDSRHLLALGTLSDSLLELGQFDEGADAAQQMMDARPDMASYSRASYLRWLQGDREGAKRFIKYALDGRDGRDPEPAAWTLVQAGMLYWNEGDYEGADAVFAEALNWVPDYPSALVGRARAALGRNQPAAAIGYLEKAYAASPLVETAWLLGDARHLHGDAAGARKEYDRAIAQGKRTDRLTLASLYATKDLAHNDALQLIETERVTRGGIYVDDVYAWALYRAGRIPEARVASDRAMRWGTLDARILYHAGAIRIAAGDKSGIELVRKALAISPRFDTTGAAEAAALLATDVKNVATR